MIDSHDLMLGNWIRDDKYCQIVDVSNIYLYAHTLKTCSPIPVTQELLKNIGFEEDTTAGEPWEFWRYWDKDGRYKLGVYPEELYCNSNRKFGLHVDNASCDSIGSGEFTYVHELQNLTRIITGHSLPITIDMLYGLGNNA